MQKYLVKIPRDILKKNKLLEYFSESVWKIVDSKYQPLEKEVYLFGYLSSRVMGLQIIK